MGYSGAGGNWFMKKTRSKKSHLVTLTFKCVNTIFVRYPFEFWGVPLGGKKIRIEELYFPSTIYDDCLPCLPAKYMAYVTYIIHNKDKKSKKITTPYIGDMWLRLQWWMHGKKSFWEQIKKGNVTFKHNFSARCPFEEYGTYRHKLNMEVDIQSLFGLYVTWCAQLYSLAKTSQLPTPPPHPPAFVLVYEGTNGQQR